MNRTTAVRGMLACAAALAGWAAPAIAETNVTLYGRVATGVDYISNVAKSDGGTGALWRGAGNQWGTSMFGFKGSEDLGGGLQAIFRLESGFDAAKGRTNGDALFNRRAYAGLSSPAWGTLTMGKNLFISNDVWFLDSTGQQFIGSATLVRGRNWPGANNLIEYQSPTWGGFQVGLQTGLGEQPGSITASRRDGVSAVYSNALVELRAIYDVIRDGNGNYSDLYNFSKEWTLGGVLKLDAWKVYGAFQRLNAPDAAAGAPSAASHYWIGATYDITRALTLIGTVFRTDVNNGGGHATLFMAGANYNFSKRTLLYATYGRVQNSKNAAFSVEATDNRPLAGQGQNGAYAGIVHSF
ncbi:porin [Ralstonia pseudosolanacearum]|uniref:porin n=1 Tax=Ralstonia pseudosolanacearum TaxID=1310165 RepID=UPI0018D19378|nr:porin [Ralstonia pseudosolanacearum]